MVNGPVTVRTPRIVGIDIARGLAVIGMFVAHTLPRTNGDELLVDGRSAILFATLAGVSLGMLTGGAKAQRAGRVRSLRGIAIRAAFLFLLGVGLSMLPSQVAIILDYYGVMFLLILPAVFLPRAVLAVIAGVLAVGAPLLADSVGTSSIGQGTGWAQLAADYLLLGRYPALVWLPFLLVGLLCARSDLSRPATQRWMLGGGIVAMVLGYGSAFTIASVSAAAHSGSTAEIVGSGGFAIALIGAILWLSRWRAARTLLSPVAAAGSMPLTIYTLQVLVLAACVAFAGTAPWVPDYPGWPLLFGLIIASLLFAWGWRAFIGAGPLERLLRFLAGFDRSASTRRPSTRRRR